MAASPGAGLARALVEQAVRAPSSHTTQPWIFHSVGGFIELYADRSRALPVNDPDAVSCSSAAAPRCSQLLLRAGFPQGRVTGAPRRPVDDVLKVYE